MGCCKQVFEPKLDISVNLFFSPEGISREKVNRALRKLGIKDYHLFYSERISYHLVIAVSNLHKLNDKFDELFEDTENFPCVTQHVDEPIVFFVAKDDCDRTNDGMSDDTLSDAVEMMTKKGYYFPFSAPLNSILYRRISWWQLPRRAKEFCSR